MTKIIRVTLTDHELRELLAVLEFADNEKFYGAPQPDPWNAEDAKAFQSLLAKARAAAGENEVPS
jgi:hypothetical protein